MTTEITTTASKNKNNFSLDYRIIIALLLVIIAGMLAWWKPWSNSATQANDRTISVTGESKISATPDEYVFNPVYEFKNSDKAVALESLTKKSAEIVDKLKGLGLSEESIKTGSGGYETYPYYYEPESRTNSYTLNVTITAKSREQAQKVQDYLVSTTPTGPVSPQTQFSENKRKELETKARDEATKEARSKAEQSAKNLGFKIGAVKSIEDGSGFNSLLRTKDMVSEVRLDSNAAPGLGVQPGQNDLRYSVSVVYFLR